MSFSFDSNFVMTVIGCFAADLSTSMNPCWLLPSTIVYLTCRLYYQQQLFFGFWFLEFLLFFSTRKLSSRLEFQVFFFLIWILFILIVEMAWVGFMSWCTCCARFISNIASTHWRRCWCTWSLPLNSSMAIPTFVAYCIMICQWLLASTNKTRPRFHHGI